VETMVQGGILARVLTAVGLGQAFAYCGETIHQAEAGVAPAEPSARASTGGVDAAVQARLEKARALIKETWDLRSRGDHAAALRKSKGALALLPAQGAPYASQMPARLYPY
jgi:hypothetical protein